LMKTGPNMAPARNPPR